MEAEFREKFECLKRDKTTKKVLIKWMTRAVKWGEGILCCM
jgi:hypothetical protein